MNKINDEKRVIDLEYNLICDFIYGRADGYDFTFDSISNLEYDVSNIESDGIAYFRKNVSNNKLEVCALFSGGTICIEPNMWSGNVSCDSSNDNCQVQGYILGKKTEFEQKGGVCTISFDSLSCFDSVSTEDSDTESDESVVCQDNINWYYYYINSSGILSSM